VKYHSLAEMSRCNIGTEADKIQMDVKCNDNYNYNKKLQPFARQLRKNLTKSEACLRKYEICLKSKTIERISV